MLLVAGGSLAEFLPCPLDLQGRQNGGRRKLSVLDGCLPVLDDIWRFPHHAARRGR